MRQGRAALCLQHGALFRLGWCKSWSDEAGGRWVQVGEYNCRDPKDRSAHGHGSGGEKSERGGHASWAGQLRSGRQHKEETRYKKPGEVLDRRKCLMVWHNSNAKRFLIEDELRSQSDEIVDEMNKKAFVPMSLCSEDVVEGEHYEEEGKLSGWRHGCLRRAGGTAAALRCSKGGPRATSATHLCIPRHSWTLVRRETLTNRCRMKTKEGG